MERNEIINMATVSLKDMVKEYPEQKQELGKDIRFLNAQKAGLHEAEMHKIKIIFLSILKDIKEDMGKGNLPDTAASAKMIRNIQAAMADRPPEKITMDDVASAVVAEIRKAVPVDEETMEQFKSLVIQIMKQAGDGAGQKELEKTQC